jgi:Holliday junction resolvase RusA-like endonuclease
MIKFTIIGKPKALKRHRPSARGGYYDPSSKDKKDIMLQIAKFKPKKALIGDIILSIRFTMPYPKKYYRTGKYSHLLKDNAPKHHSIKPDLDNLVKLISDVLQPDFYVDDSQICQIYAEKMYGKNPNTAIIIQEI